MKGTTATRSRRAAGSDSYGREGSGREGYGYGAYVSGANALQVDYADPGYDLDPAYDNDTGYGTGVESTVERTPTVAPARPRRATRTRRTPWVSDVTAPQASPLPINLPRAPFLTLIVAVVVVGVLGVLVLNTKINENSFRLNDLKSSQAVLDQQEQHLSGQLADLESPGNLRAAATRLGLVPAGTPAFINLPDGRVVGVPQPAGR